MGLHLGQIIYTSFADVGLKVLRSDSVSQRIAQIFLQKIAFRYWNSYNPPSPGYRAAYLLQIAPEHTLFGWLYNDRCDDLGRSHLPYFISYYLENLLSNSQLDNLLLCLQKGPVFAVSPQNPNATLKDLELADFSYQPTRPGVLISDNVRQRSYQILQKKQLLDLLIPSADSPQSIDQRTAADTNMRQSDRAEGKPRPTQAGSPAASRKLGQTVADSAKIPASSASARLSKIDRVQLLLGVGIAATMLALVGLVYVLQVSIAPKNKQPPSSWRGTSLAVIGLPASVLSANGTSVDSI